jgi:putative endonuclease
MYTLYILYSENIDRYYVGYTNDFPRRFSEHNRIKHKYTDGGIPWILVYSEEFNNKKLAMEREKYIKSKKSRSYILELITSNKI